MAGAAAEAPRFRSLIPQRSGHETLSADEALSDWRAQGDDELRVALNMIASVDGRIAVDGHSAALGGPADRALFHALRARADAVMVAAGTLRAERYGPIIRNAGVRQLRVDQGLPEQPLAVIVSRGLDLDPDAAAARRGRRARRGPHTVGGRPPRVRSGGRLHPDLNAARRSRRAACEIRNAPGALRGRPRAEWGARRRVADRRALPGDLAAAGRRHPRGALAADGGRPREPLALELRMLLEYESQLYAHYVSLP